MRPKCITHRLAIWACLVIGLGVWMAPMAIGRAATVSDKENCLLCHRYPAMGRIDRQGQRRIFYVNEYQFSHSVHGKLRCKNCHVGLDQIPHAEVPPVDCTTNCHLEEPSTNKEFSHAGMAQQYDASVHGANPNDTPKPYPEDLPTCKYCHNNRRYNPLQGMWGSSEALSKETLARCRGCHTNADWASRFYSHFTHRMRKRRSQQEIVALCTSCHEDSAKMARHGLESIETYKDTYHWVQVKYGVTNAPDCISCHIPVGFSTHDIRPRSDSLSPLHPDNRVQTCSNQGGLQVCHPGATEAFAGGRVHAYGLKARLRSGDMTAGDDDAKRSLVADRAQQDIPGREVLQYRILQAIRLFYKLLIAGVIGFMVMHQSLDYYRSAKRNHRP